MRMIRTARFVTTLTHNARLRTSTWQRFAFTTTTNQSNSTNASIAPVSTVLKLPEIEFGHVKMLQWMKEVGDAFSEGDSLAELDSDLAVIEYKAQSDGVLALIVAQPGDKLHANSILGVACEKASQIDQAITEYEEAEGLTVQKNEKHK